MVKNVLFLESPVPNLPVKQLDYKTLRGAPTSLRGYLAAERAEVTRVLGFAPLGESGDGKVDFEWIFSVDGVVVTIYRWKGDTSRLNVGGNTSGVLITVILEKLFGAGRFTAA